MRATEGYGPEDNLVHDPRIDDHLIETVGIPEAFGYLPG